MKYDVDKMKELLEQFDFDVTEDTEKIDFIYKNVIEFGKRQYKTMDIQREKARLFFPVTITLMVFFAGGILGIYDSIFKAISLLDPVYVYITIPSILLSFIFLFLSSHNFHKVLRNVKDMIYEVPPIHDLEIYSKNIYDTKSAIIHYLFKAVNKREKQLEKLTKYIDKGISYINLGIIFIFISSIISFHILMDLNFL